MDAVFWPARAEHHIKEGAMGAVEGALAVIARTEDGFFELCADGRTLIVAGNTAEILDRQEFSMLELLIKNENRVLSRDELLDEIWGDRFVEERRVDACVACLRRVFERHRPPYRIRTIHGTGYQFANGASAKCQLLKEFQREPGGFLELYADGQLHCDTKPVCRLERLQIQLFCLLTENFGRYQTPRMIASRLSDFRKTIESKNVPTHMTKMRATLKKCRYGILHDRDSGYKMAV